ncbi:hypothetical protein L486_02983 [Kwoniella mangroviensis CBS 10435]|uniref:RNase III domain-containing protein n=1 Tax=Kwoniella mangroviensis CBS 10435 TaxID=1331196 RepID=A0A1B9IXQ0_9TREE|nr:hypothetical protein L486_02983 [Kwoniella mangroviensis CBS 10435]
MESLSLSSTTSPLIIPSDIPLPPLPIIQDVDIQRKVFTHSSFIAKPKYFIELFENDEESRDNEKLELIGDSLLGSSVLGLLQDLYPNLSVGQSTRIKSSLVSNPTLREICRRYHLNEKLIAPPEQLPTLINGEKVLANLFEASNFVKLKLPTPPRSPNQHAHSLSPSSSSLSVYISASGEASSPTRGQAIDHLDLWLRPLFQPIAESMLDQLKQQQIAKHLLIENDEDVNTDKNAIGANSRLNQWFISKEGGMPDYASSTAGMQGWKTLCTAVDRYGKNWYGEATRSTKKAAMAVAAYKVIVQFEQERPDFKA